MDSRNFLLTFRKNHSEVCFMPLPDIVGLHFEDSLCANTIKVLKDTAHPNHHSKSLYYLLEIEVLYREIVRDGAPHLLVVVPEEIWKVILVGAHDTLVGGHVGIARTYARIKVR